MDWMEGERDVEGGFFVVPVVVPVPVLYACLPFDWRVRPIWIRDKQPRLERTQSTIIKRAFLFCCRLPVPDPDPTKYLNSQTSIYLHQ